MTKLILLSAICLGLVHPASAMQAAMPARPGALCVEQAQGAMRVAYHPGAAAVPLRCTRILGTQTVARPKPNLHT